MYAFASALATSADSAGSGDSNLTSTSRLLRIGATVRLPRNRSIVLDWVFVSSAPGAAGGGAALNQPATRATGAPTIVPTVSASRFGLNCGLSQSFAASIVLRARARLCRILYCVW